MYHPKKALGAREGSGGYLGEEEVGGMRRTTKRGGRGQKETSKDPLETPAPLLQPFPKNFSILRLPKNTAHPIQKQPPSRHSPHRRCSGYCSALAGLI